MSAGFWTIDRVRRALGGGPAGTRVLRSVSTDSRTVAEGDIFVALRGPRYNGHEYAAEAVARGAAALVVESLPRATRLGVPIFEVRDTLVALGTLATYWRSAWGRPLVAIAGSNGKTSTKDLTAAALGTRFLVHATTANLNNRIGVPLTLLAMPPASEIAVVEIGTSAPGEIAILRDIVRPDISVVTCVAEEHLEGLVDLAGVLREEASAFDSVDLGIAPAAQEEVAAQARARARQAISAGLDSGDYRAERWSLDGTGLGTIELDGETIRPPLRGAHNLANTMLALAVARACGVPVADAARGIGAMSALRMRTAWEPLGRATLINDSYNANPASTRAALELLRSLAGGRQRVAVLGTMRELGPESARYHDEIVSRALEVADVVAGVGEFAAALARAGPTRATVVTASDLDDLWPRLAPVIAPDAVILLKASRGVQIERLVPLLQEWAAKAA